MVILKSIVSCILFTAALGAETTATDTYPAPTTISAYIPGLPQNVTKIYVSAIEVKSSITILNPNCGYCGYLEYAKLTIGPTAVEASGSVTGVSIVSSTGVPFEASATAVCRNETNTATCTGTISTSVGTSQATVYTISSIVPNPSPIPIIIQGGAAKLNSGPRSAAASFGMAFAGASVALGLLLL